MHMGGDFYREIALSNLRKNGKEYAGLTFVFFQHALNQNHKTK
jgi:hypothetical protein